MISKFLDRLTETAWTVATLIALSASGIVELWRAHRRNRKQYNL